MHKIAQNIHFFAFEVGKTTSRCFFGKNRFFFLNDIFYLWDINFSRNILQALEKTFLCKKQAQYPKFHTHLQVSKNI